MTEAQLRASDETRRPPRGPDSAPRRDRGPAIGHRQGQDHRPRRSEGRRPADHHGLPLRARLAAGWLLQPGHLLRALRLPDHRAAGRRVPEAVGHQAVGLLAPPGPSAPPRAPHRAGGAHLLRPVRAAPGLYPDFRLSAFSALFYFSNWWQIAASGNYFVATGAVSPLTHTWSLAVEEQFYLVWP